MRLFFELTCQDFPFTQMMGGDHSLSKQNTWKEDVCNIICVDRHKRMQQDMPLEITEIFSKKTFYVSILWWFLAIAVIIITICRVTNRTAIISILFIFNGIVHLKKENCYHLLILNIYMLYVLQVLNELLTGFAYWINS